MFSKSAITFVNIRDLFTRRFVNQNSELKLLDEKVIFRSGSYKRVRRWFEGMHSFGVIIKGFTGWETVIEQDVIIPTGTFIIEDYS